MSLHGPKLLVAGALLLGFWSVIARADPPVVLDQGPAWTDLARADFYSRDQGSRMMPIAWLRALKRYDGQPFLADTLARYGYLPNPTGRDGLPIGFTVSGPGGAQVAGLTCAACHTRQITVSGKSYRIDGGPAIADFQAFLADLDAAVAAALADPNAFAAFAASALPPGQTADEDVAALRADVQAWADRYRALVSRALPAASWGPGRLDAIGMIFDRLTGLDLGPEENGHVIAGNIRVADAPVRYPFIWNAPLQDQTQWPGFADNGDDILGLARNLGEVYGVFAEFAPQPRPLPAVLDVDFSSNNSANFDGLNRLEQLVRQIGPPTWPWAIDTELAAKGHAIFNRAPGPDGGCAACHAIQPGKIRFSSSGTWRTPVQDVGTDSREYQVIAWSAQTGNLQGAFVPFALPLGATEPTVKILKTAVIGSIVQHYLEFFAPMTSQLRRVLPGQSPFTLDRLGSARMPPELQALQGAFGPPGADLAAPAGTPSSFPYEARVLQGIWAAAPYLHNGSVPTLRIS